MTLIGQDKLLYNQEHVPRPTSKLRVMGVLNLRAKAKAIAVLINSSRFLVIEVDGLEAEVF
jgi:hypothetical protein